MKKVWKKKNIYKPGTKKYYIDQLYNIEVILHFEKYKKYTAKEARDLLKDLRRYISDAINHKKLYFELEFSKKLKDKVKKRQKERKRK